MRPPRYEHYREVHIGDARPKPVPASPVSCRRCGATLEPLRRYAGLCAACIKHASPPPVAPTAKVKSTMRVLRRFTRVRPDGRTEKYVIAMCKCKRRRTLQESEWKRLHPRCCQHCHHHRLKVEYGR